MNERIVAVVPIRSLRHGKTRLTPVLGEEARQTLLRHVADRVVTAAVDSGVIETVLVVSPEAETLAWAAGLGPKVVAAPQPDNQPGLNGAIAAGRVLAMDRGASSMISLFADLPLIVPEDIRDLVWQSEPVVLGPDRRGEGTNALLLRLTGRGGEFSFTFGDGSLARHRAEAHRLSLEAAVLETPGIAFDLDTPDDWADFVAIAATSSDACAATPAQCAAGVG